MADEPEKSGQEPNLELPSFLAFGRRKKGRTGDRTPEEGTTPESHTGTVAGSPAGDVTATHAPEDADPLTAAPVAPPRGRLAPSAAKAKRLPPLPPPTARKPPTPPPTAPPPVTPAQDSVMEAESEPEPATGTIPVLPIGRFTSAPSIGEPTSPQLTAPAYADQSQLLAEPPAAPAVAPDQRSAATGRRAVSMALPVINPRIATVLTGVLVGLIGVVLAYLTGRGCEQVRGVGSCGGLGLFALLVILAVMVVLGASMLKAWRVYDPVSTSFLGVGLIAVVVLLFLLSSLDSIWMLLVIPVLSGFTFLLSWWVTETLIEDNSGTR